MIKVCSEIARNLRKTSSTISSTAAEQSAPPPMKPHALRRLNSDPVYQDARKEDVEKERNDAWQRAIGERKRYVPFATCKPWSVSEIIKMVGQIKACESFKPEIGVRHRVFFVSADLMGVDSTATPWSSPIAWTEVHKVAFEAATTPTGPADVSVVFDGCSRQVRRELEDLIENNAWTSCSELSLVYRSKKKPNTGGRLNLFSRQNVEN